MKNNDKRPTGVSFPLKTANGRVVVIQAELTHRTID